MQEEKIIVCKSKLKQKLPFYLHKIRITTESVFTKIRQLIGIGVFTLENVVLVDLNRLRITDDLHNYNKLLHISHPA